MKTLKIKTWLPVFPGFYGTNFEPDEETVIEHPYKFDDYDFFYDDYQRDCSEQCVYAIQDKLKEIGFNCKIVFEQLRSPREYNFSNDAIDVTFKITPAFIKKLKKYCTDNLGDFDEYLERYKSRSGFISHYSSLFTDWLGYIEPEYLENNAHILGSLLDFVLTNENYQDHNLYESVSGNCWLFGEVKESSLPTEFELNGVVFAGNYDEIKDSYDNWIGTCFNFFDWCLVNLKQIVKSDPNQLSLW